MGAGWNVCRDRKTIFSTLFWTLEKNGILHLNCHLQRGEQSRWSEWASFLAMKYTRGTWTVSESSRNSSLIFRSRLEGKKQQPSWKETCSSWRWLQGEEGTPQLCLQAHPHHCFQLVSCLFLAKFKEEAGSYECEQFSLERKILIKWCCWQTILPSNRWK